MNKLMIILKGIGYAFLKTVFRNYDKENMVLYEDVGLERGFK